MGENKDIKSNKVYLGIDLGTNSVGWAVTDGNFKLLRRRHQHLWGIRLFDEAKTASDRRLHRSQRKRLARRRARIFELRQLMKSEIDKVDPNFFYRLDYSFAFDWKDEARRKRIKKSILFADPHFTDKDFFKKYPTIFHLRKALMEWDGAEKPDIRFVYLALHHIIKYRGNFLDPSENIGENVSENEIKSLFLEIDNSYLNLYPADKGEQENITPSSFGITDEQASFIKNEIFKKNDGFSSTSEAINNLFQERRLTAMEKGIVKLISGGKVSFHIVFPGDVEDVDGLESFSLDDWDEKIEPKLDSYPEDVSSILIACKRLYDSHKLTRILGSNDFISSAMVERYERHKQQLRALKKFVKTYYPNKYNDIFREPSNGKNSAANYSHYIGSTLVGGRKGRDFVGNTAGRGGHVKRDDFYKFLKKELELDEKKIKGREDSLVATSPTYEFERAKIDQQKRILELIEANDFLLRQNGGENGVIKRQIHQKELERIIERMEGYYPFLAEKDADGLTVSDKIKSIFKLKIPYYIGPLDNNLGNPNSWAKKTDAWKNRKPGEIHPWNWEKFVDKDQAAEEFIKRMVNKCSYILSEDTLPRFSILYSEFCVLNEINKILIKSGNGLSYFDQATKDEILELYKENGKLSKTDIKNVVKKHIGTSDFELYTAGATSDDDKPLTGEYLKANMRSYSDLKGILQDAFDVEKAEHIIMDITLFEDRNILVQRVKRLMPNLSADQISRITKLKYKGWGNLSRKLLTKLRSGVVDDNGVVSYTGPSIIELMRRVSKKDGSDYSENFMQILFKEDYHFEDLLEEINEESSDGYSDYVHYVNESLYGSPMTKRAIIQSMKVIREVEHIIGRRVDAIFMESPRGQDPSIPQEKRNINGNELNRSKVLDKLYKYAQRLATERYAAFSTSVQKMKKKLDEGNVSLQAKRYYLYFTQLGYDVYTGKAIDFDDLNKENLYDVDHIIPRSMKKDDSLDNLVLVSQRVNRDVKKDIYPIPSNIIRDNPAAQKVIEFLHKSGLMSDSKFNRLMRPVTRPVTDDEKATFINRQIVSTSQSIKQLRDVLHKDYFNALKKEHPEWDDETIDHNIPELNMPKASLAHDFREKFDIPKCRETNDFHHAHDAYLNIVTGECSKSFFHLAWKIHEVNKKWVKTDQDNKDRILEKNPERKVTTKLVNKIFDGNIRSRFSTSEFDWISDQGTYPTIAIVKKQLKNNDILYTKMLTRGSGDFYDQLVLSPRRAQGKDLDVRASVKSIDGKDSRLALMGDVSKYGYYDNAKTSFYSLIKYTDKKNVEIFALLPVKNDIACKYISNEDFAIEYARYWMNSKNVRILIKRILVNSLLTVGPETLPVRITAKTGDSFAYELSYQPFYSQELQKYCNSLIFLNEKIKEINKASDKDKNGHEEKSGEVTQQIINLISITNQRITNDCLYVNQDNNLKLYDYIIGHFMKPKFKATYMYTLFCKDSSKHRELFINLPIDGQIEILVNLLTLAECKRQLVDLTKIGLSKKTGGLKLSLKLSGPFAIYTESPTGFYRHKIFELDAQGNGKVFLADGCISDVDH